MAHGGDQEKIGLAGPTTDTTDMRLLMFDGMLRLCARTLSEAARGSSLFDFIATRRQL